MDRAVSESKRISQLAARRDSAYDEWLALSRDPSCWSDPEKRKAMLKARISYQDALSEYVTTLRALQASSARESKKD
jgi:hypothetical protein